MGPTEIDRLAALASAAQDEVQREANRQIANRGKDPWVLRLRGLEFESAAGDDEYLRAVRPSAILELVGLVRGARQIIRDRHDRAERSRARAEACGMAFDFGRLQEETKNRADEAEILSRVLRFVAACDHAPPGRPTPRSVGAACVNCIESAIKSELRRVAKS